MYNPYWLHFDWSMIINLQYTLQRIITSHFYDSRQCNELNRDYRHYELQRDVLVFNWLAN